jgi:hypothetical protein
MGYKKWEVKRLEKQRRTRAPDCDTTSLRGAVTAQSVKGFGYRQILAGSPKHTKYIFFPPGRTRPTLAPTQPPIQWIRSLFYAGKAAAA